MRRSVLLLVVAGCAKAPGATPATWEALEAAARAPLEERPLAGPAPDWDLVGGTVMTAAGSTFAPGRVVLRGGRVAFVGPADAGPACPTCAVVDVTGRFVTPGLIDTHSHLGVYASPGDLRALSDGNEAVAATTPGVWAESGIWPEDPGFLRAVAGGITALEVLPGSANLIGGRGVVIRPVPARGGRAMRFEGAPETVKMACGENPKRVYGDKGGPQTRMGNVRGWREAFAAARSYQEKWERKGDPPERDLDLDTLVGVLRGDFLLQVHCYRADDMLGFLQVAHEFGFHVRSFHHAIEAYKIRDVLAREQVSVSTWSDWWGFKSEAWDEVLPNAAMVATAGARAVIHSDSEVGIQRLNQEAGKARQDGIDQGFPVSEDEALRWITANPAWTLGIDGETGTLEAGKRADVVVWDHHPFSIYAEATDVFVEGHHVFDRAHAEVWSSFLIGTEVSR